LVDWLKIYRSKCVKYFVLLLTAFIFFGCTSSEIKPVNKHEIFNKVYKNTYYPREAIDQGLEGTVTIEATINENGHAVGTKILESSGHTILDTSAIRTILATTFPKNRLKPLWKLVIPVRYTIEKGNKMNSP
jgi:TonB family protein